MPYWRLSAYYFFYFAFIGAFTPYFGLYLQSLSLAAWQIGVLMSLMQVMRVVAPNAWGWLADHLGHRLPIVRAAGALSALAFAGFFLTDSFAGLFAAMACLAFFWGAALPLVESTTMGHLAQQSARYGRVRLWGSIGFLVAVLAVGYALDHVPLRSLLWIAAAIQLGIFLAALLVPEAPDVGRPGPQDSLAPVLRRPEVLALLGACFFMSAAHGALYIFYSIHLVDFGYAKSLVGWLWTLGVLAEIAVFVWMPRMVAAWSLRDILLASLALAALRFLLIGWLADVLAVAVLAQLLHGATFGAYHVAALGAVNRWFAGGLQARGQALYSSVSFGAGGMVGGLVAGYTWDALGAAVTFTVSAAFAVIGLAWLLRGWHEPSSPAVEMR